MENTNIKFTLSKKELFWLNIISHIKTVVIVLVIGGILGIIGLMIFALDRLMPAVDWQSLTQNAWVLSAFVCVAGLIYALGVILFWAIRLLVMSKTSPEIFDQRLIIIEKDRAIISYSNNNKDIIKWGQFKIHYENPKYLILKSDINTFILKKEVLSPQDLVWLKQNLKEQNLIEYRKMLEAKRKR